MIFKPNRKKPKRPSKKDDVLIRIRDLVKMGLYRDTRHSFDQGKDRDIDLGDIKEILGTAGYHEKRKDEWKEEFQSWNYAIRGKTFDGKDLRIAVYFEKDLVMIATVIDLGME